MKKLYYTHPLKAAWMAWEFKVQFAWKHAILMINGRYLDVIEKEISEGGRIEIHPDSLPIFEPKEGDLVMAASKPFAFIATAEDIEIIKENGIYRKIIQRDNKAFFTPEVEA